MTAFTTLVLGGYGNFGARICRALAGGSPAQQQQHERPPMALLVAGRGGARAPAHAGAVGGERLKEGKVYLPANAARAASPLTTRRRAWPAACVRSVWTW